MGVGPQPARASLREKPNRVAATRNCRRSISPRFSCSRRSAICFCNSSPDILISSFRFVVPLLYDSSYTCTSPYTLTFGCQIGHTPHITSSLTSCVHRLCQAEDETPCPSAIGPINKEVTSVLSLSAQSSYLLCTLAGVGIAPHTLSFIVPGGSR